MKDVVWSTQREHLREMRNLSKNNVEELPGRQALTEEMVRNCAKQALRSACHLQATITISERGQKDTWL